MEKLKAISGIKVLLGICVVGLLTACEGPEGPPGRDGANGRDAPIAEVFEESVSFQYDTESNTWFSNFLSFSGVENGDFFMVFISFGNGLYTPLPASVFDEFGEFQYVFDHDLNTVELQIIGDNDLSTLDNISTQNIPVRVAIIPAVLVAGFSAEDLLDLNKIMDLSGLGSEDIKTIIR